MFIIIIYTNRILLWDLIMKVFFINFCLFILVLSSFWQCIVSCVSGISILAPYLHLCSGKRMKIVLSHLHCILLHFFVAGLKPKEAESQRESRCNDSLCLMLCPRGRRNVFSLESESIHDEFSSLCPWPFSAFSGAVLEWLMVVVVKGWTGNSCPLSLQKITSTVYTIKYSW